MSAVSKGSGGTGGRRSGKRRRAAAARVAVISEPKGDEETEEGRRQLLSGAAAGTKGDAKGKKNAKGRSLNHHYYLRRQPAGQLVIFRHFLLLHSSEKPFTIANTW